MELTFVSIKNKRISASPALLVAPVRTAKLFPSLDPVSNPTASVATVSSILM